MAFAMGVVERTPGLFAAKAEEGIDDGFGLRSSGGVPLLGRSGGPGVFDTEEPAATAVHAAEIVAEDDLHAVKVEMAPKSRPSVVDSPPAMATARAPGTRVLGVTSICKPSGANWAPTTRVCFIARMDRSRLVTRMGRVVVVGVATPRYPCHRARLDPFWRFPDSGRRLDESRYSADVRRPRRR